MTERECDDGKRLGRLEKTRQFLRAADLVEVFLEDVDVGDAYVTLCVHSGIAAADVICCARLGRHAQGDNHDEAIALLDRAGSKEGAKHLAVLLGLKSKAGYTAAPSSKTDVKRARRAAQALVELAERI
jgi:hypothetical protein